MHMSIVFMFLGIFSSKLPKTVRFDILYEKEIRPFKNNFAIEILNRILEDYNNHLSEIGVKFLLNSILDYKQYSNMREYRVYSKLVGSGDLEKRRISLDKIQKNLIIIYSSLEKKDRQAPNTINSCKDRVFVNMRNFEAMPDEVIQMSLESIKKYMGDLLKIEIPEFYQLENILIPENARFEHFYSLIDPDAIEEINDCLVDNIIAEKMFLNDSSPLSSRAYVFKDGNQIKSYLSRARRQHEMNSKQSDKAKPNFEGDRLYNRDDQIAKNSDKDMLMGPNLKKKLINKPDTQTLNEKDDVNCCTRCSNKRSRYYKKERKMSAKPDDNIENEGLFYISSSESKNNYVHFVDEPNSGLSRKFAVIKKRKLISSAESSSYLNKDDEILRDNNNFMQKDTETSFISSPCSERRFDVHKDYALCSNRKEDFASKYFRLKRKDDVLTLKHAIRPRKYNFENVTYISDGKESEEEELQQKRRNMAKNITLSEDCTT